MTRFIRILTISWAAVIVAAAAGAPASAQGMVDDTDCVMAGLLGEEFGLCNAYCEAMDCDGDTPQASAKACEKVRAKFEAIEGAPELPCLGDSTNAKPVVDLSPTDDGTFDTTATFVSFGGAVPIALDVAITDDGTVITSAKITLKNPVAGENETLALTSEGLLLLEGLNAGEVPSGGSSVFDPVTSELNITGTGDLHQYEDLIQQVVYDNGIDAPDLTLDRTIDVSVTDDADDATAVSLPAVSLLIVNHGCPCSSFTTDAVVTPGVVALFRGTQFRCNGPMAIDWCWRNASCTVVELRNTPDVRDFFLLLLVDGVVSRAFRFASIIGSGCTASGSSPFGNTLYGQNRFLSTGGVSRPSEIISEYTPEMHAACRARIPIQIERLLATFHAGGVDGGAANCAPIGF